LILRVRITAKNPQSAPVKAVLWIQLSAMEHKPGIDSKGTVLLFANAMPQPIPYEGGPLRLDGSSVLDQKGALRATIDTPIGSSLRLFSRSELPSDSPEWQAARKSEPLDHLLHIELPVPAGGESVVRLTAPVYPLDEAADRRLKADAF